jgi:tRNA pseudouridine32 synthase/23S rRNA pseudouridine746 synthase
VSAAADAAAALGEDLAGRVLYRDGLMLVIDKPAGIAVHAGPKGGLTLDAGFEALRFGLPRPPQLAHRLDRETSGCLVLGRHPKALASLGNLFASGRVEKTYLAVLRGKLPAAEGRIELPLSKRSATRGWWMKVDPEGQPAATDYRVLAEGESLSLVQLSPLTGRTHQLRVHMAAQGAPILGDRIYGREPAPPAGPPLHLHAWRIRVPLYPRRPSVEIEAPLPATFKATLDGLGWRCPVE